MNTRPCVCVWRRCWKRLRATLPQNETGGRRRECNYTRADPSFFSHATLHYTYTYCNSIVTISPQIVTVCNILRPAGGGTGA